MPPMTFTKKIKQFRLAPLWTTKFLLSNMWSGPTMVQWKRVLCAAISENSVERIHEKPQNEQYTDVCLLQYVPIFVIPWSLCVNKFFFIFFFYLYVKVAEGPGLDRHKKVKSEPDPDQPKTCRSTTLHLMAQVFLNRYTCSIKQSRRELTVFGFCFNLLSNCARITLYSIYFINFYFILQYGTVLYLDSGSGKYSGWKPVLSRYSGSRLFSWSGTDSPLLPQPEVPSWAHHSGESWYPGSRLSSL